ncbi:PRRC2A isoform X1 [Pelobates cultripes]|uniref:PRRC2A isoform X1 n=2 Tax=Pelobates cultripes TaxID=61616 RepID=A0AAD1SZ07_PELCU|nr:PRRC2A isoform X1 [Pelobates cultripes]
MDGENRELLADAAHPPNCEPAPRPGLPGPTPQQFPPYRGMLAPFMYPPYLPFPPPYGPQGAFRFHGPDAPRFPRLAPPRAPHTAPRMPDPVNRPSILKQDDLKEFDELEQEADDGWAGAHEEVDYTEKLKFSDDEDGKDTDTEEKRDFTDPKTEQASAPPPQKVVEPSDARKGTPTEEKPPSAKAAWTEVPRAPEPIQAPVPTAPPAQRGVSSQRGPQPEHKEKQTAPPPVVEDEDEAWRQRRKQSSSEISQAVERARRRREEEERRMEEERRAACAEKLKRLDMKRRPAPEEPEAAPRARSVGAEEAEQRSQTPPVMETPPAVVTVPQPAVVPIPPESPPVKVEPASPSQADIKPEPAPPTSRPPPAGPSQVGYSKFQKSLPPRFQRQQQEQLMKQWQQSREPTPPSPSGPSPTSHPPPAPSQQPLQKNIYGGGGSLGRTTPVPAPQPTAPLPPPHVSYDPRWVMVPPFIDPRLMQGRPLDYYTPTAGVHPTGLMSRERSDSGGSGSDGYERHPPLIRERGTPPTDPKIIWGGEMYNPPEARPLASPLRPNPEEEGRDIRSETPPIRTLPPQHPQSSTYLGNYSYPENAAAATQQPHVGHGHRYTLDEQRTWHQQQNHAAPQHPTSTPTAEQRRPEVVPSPSPAPAPISQPRPVDDEPVILRREVSIPASQPEAASKPEACNARHKEDRKEIAKEEPVTERQTGRHERQGGRPDYHKPIPRRESKTETRWGPRPGGGGNRKQEEPATVGGGSSQTPSQRRVGPIKRAVKREETVATERHEGRITQAPPAASEPQKPKQVGQPSREGEPAAVSPSRRRKETTPLMPARGSPALSSVSRGRGRGEYFARGRGFRGAYSGRGRGGRGRSREFRGGYRRESPFYREDGDVESKSIRDPGGRERNASETRSEGSEYEEVPKRRRQRGSETGSETEPAASEKEVGKVGLQHHHQQNEVLVSNHQRHPDKGRDSGRGRTFTPRGVPSRRGRGGAPMVSVAWNPHPKHQPAQPQLPPTQPPPQPHKLERKNEKVLVSEGPPVSNEERPPPPPRRRRHHGRSQQQDKPPRFRRLKQERENAARAGNGGGQQPPPTQQQLTQEQHQRPAQNEEDRIIVRRGHKSPEPCNANSDQANEEWETASESSDFTEKKERGEVLQNGGSITTSTIIGGGRDQRKDLSKRSFSSQRPVMERQNRRPMHPAGPRTGRGGGGGGKSGEKRNWPSPRNRGGRTNEDRPPPSVPLSHSASSTSAVYRVDRVIHSNPVGIQQALNELGQRHNKPAPANNNMDSSGGRCQQRADSLLDTRHESVNETFAVPLPKRATRPRRSRDIAPENVHFSGAPVSSRRWQESVTRNHHPETLAPRVWSRDQSNDRGKLGPSYSMEPWMEPLTGYEDPINTEMSQSDSGVDLSSDSQLSSSSCSQRSSPDGGMKPEGGKRSGHPVSTGQSQQGHPQVMVPPPDPIGMERAQKPMAEGPLGPSAPSCLPSAPHSPSPQEPCHPADSTKYGREKQGGSSQQSCMVASSPRTWDIPPQLATAEHQMDHRQLALSPSHPEGSRHPLPDDRSQRIFSNQYYQLDLHVTTTGNGYRPGTPSLQQYRSQPLYLHAAPSPGSSPALLPGSAVLSGIALKGQYVDFSDLAKVPAGSLLYPAPAFLYSGHYCPAQVSTDQQQPLMQVRQDMTSASDYYSPSLHHTGQGGYLPPAATQQVLLSMVDSSLPVMGFGSLSSAPQQPPLVPMGQAMQPLQQVSASDRSQSHLRNEFQTQSPDIKQPEDHRRAVGGAGPCIQSSGGRSKSSNSNYGIVRNQRFDVYQQALPPEASRWTLRSWDRPPTRDAEPHNARDAQSSSTPAPRDP